MILFSLLLMACTTSESSPRHIYNEGSRKLAAQELEEASTQLLDARDKAGSDATLRQYAAYNLALSHAQKGLPLEESDPDAASEEYAKAVSWFRDAIRINPTDEEARYNLEIALKRIQMLADKRNAGKNGLEPRLDRLLEDTRTLRDQMRSLSSQVESTGDLQDPSGYRTQFDALAIQARTLQADASTILQLSGAERSEIENKLEEEQSDQDKMRMAQLSNLDFHLNFGRDEIADARRSLRRLNIEQAFDRLEETVRKVKRAREQLLDPVTVLKVLAQEEEQLTQQTMSLLASKNQDLLIDADQEEEAKRLPGWFNGTFLSKSQNGISERTKEMLQRFEYAGESDSSEAAPEEQEMMALVQDAVIPLSKASDSMTKAKAALESESFTVAVQEEYQSLLALAQAIERFADAKTLIELSYETQNALLYRITPSEDSQQEDIPEQERLDQVNRSLGENIGRIQRLQGALEREKQKQLQQVQASAGESQEENPADSVHALFEEAERLRSLAQKSLDDMKIAIDTENDGIPSGQAALQSMSELRILFFSIVEHLKALLENQSTMRDRTTATAEMEYERMKEELGLLYPEQDEMRTKTQAIGEALQQQADSAAQSNPDQAERLQNAYAEVALAESYMDDILESMQNTQNETGGMSHELDPALEAQQGAIEALAAALQALQPPQQDQGENQDQQDQQMSKSQAEQKLQAAREREKKRTENKQEQKNLSEPVEKDW